MKKIAEYKSSVLSSLLPNLTLFFPLTVMTNNDYACMLSRSVISDSFTTQESRPNVRRTRMRKSQTALQSMVHFPRKISAVPCKDGCPPVTFFQNVGTQSSTKSSCVLRAGPPKMVFHKQSGAKRRRENFFLAPQAECIRIWADRSLSALTSLWGHSLLTLLQPGFVIRMWVRHPLPNLVQEAWAQLALLLPFPSHLVHAGIFSLFPGTHLP